MRGKATVLDDNEKKTMNVTVQTPVSLSHYSDLDEAKWDAFVTGHPCGTPFHLSAWKKCIESTFGFRPYYLLVKDGDSVRGVLPLFLVENVILRKALISSPFAVYGGALASDEESLRLLQNSAHALGQELDVEYVELRNGFLEQTLIAPNVDRYVTFTKALDSNDDLLASLPKKTRNMVRKAQKTPFTSRIHNYASPGFERLHSETMRRLGTPSFPKRHFAAIMKHFPGIADVREVLLDDKVVAASLNFHFRGSMHIYYAAADRDFNALAPNTFMYYDHLQWAITNGRSEFEFGRSKRDTGPFEFKTHWGTQMRPLPYNVILVRKATVPNYTPTNGKFALATKMWSHLPLPLTRALGPRFIRLFP